VIDFPDIDCNDNNQHEKAPNVTLTYYINTNSPLFLNTNCSMFIQSNGLTCSEAKDAERLTWIIGGVVTAVILIIVAVIASLVFVAFYRKWRRRNYAPI